MKYAKKQIEPGIVVLEMTGRFLMGSDCQAVSGEIDSHIQSNEKNFIFDLTTLDHVDSAAVGQIVKCYSKLKKARRDIAAGGGAWHGRARFENDAGEQGDSDFPDGGGRGERFSGGEVGSGGWRLEAGRGNRRSCESAVGFGICCHVGS